MGELAEELTGVSCVRDMRLLICVEARGNIKRGRGLALNHKSTILKIYETRESSNLGFYLMVTKGPRMLVT
jgi:hypothetical protein